MSRFTADQKKLPDEQARVSRDDAWTVVLDNAGLVKAVTQRYVRSLTRGWGYTFGFSPDEVYEEAIGAAWEGALRGVERFDPSKGTKLSTYVVPAIHNAIFDALESLFATKGVRLRQRDGGAGVEVIPLDFVDPESVVDPRPLEDRVIEAVDNAAWLTSLDLTEQEKALVDAVASSLECSVKEAARVVGVTYSQAKHGLAAARQKARDCAEAA